uniref:Transducin/WD40 repeat-like superfamily protein n=1 Tax=Chenopodium quinoa TaxID=63459 RepID=A0A803MN54_CHEQI
MPRTTTIECPGCPPLRALTFDVLGLVKVIEARSKLDGVPKVVERWGDPDSSKAILAASINDRKSNPVWKASLRRIEDFDSHTGSVSFATPETWSVCGSGEICCSKVHADEGYSVFGGKGIEINMWDLEKTSKIWSAKSPQANNLGIFTPTCFTSLTFLSNDDHRKVVVGTKNHQVCLYDTSSQRRPVLSIDFRETPIKSVVEDLDGHTIYVGNGSGDLGSFDIRTGKLLGCFLGKCSGSIRSITRHPEHSIIASCELLLYNTFLSESGLDSYVRFWDINSRQLLSAVFLKQHLTNVVFDSNFSNEETTIATDPHKDEIHVSNEEQFQNEEDALPVKRKKASKGKIEAKKKKSKKVKKVKDEVHVEE